MIRVFFNSESLPHSNNSRIFSSPTSTSASPDITTSARAILSGAESFLSLFRADLSFAQATNFCRIFAYSQ